MGTTPICGTSGKGSRNCGRWAAAAILPTVLATVALAGCNARVRVDRQLWNLFSIENAFDQGANIAMCPTLPDGIPASDILTQNAAGAVTLKVQRAFGAGTTAAFVTTEIWINYYDAVWLQPLYGQLVDAGPPPTPVAGAPAVIDVGPGSTFYSPFWQISLAVVGDIPPDRIQSTKQLLDSASEIIPVATKTCPLRPLGIVGSGLTLPPPWDAWNGVALQTIREGQVVFEEEGQAQHFGLFDFGSNLYETEVEGHGAIVEARPMFVFARPDGSLATGEPRVLGAGEVGVDAAGQPRPRFGGLWQVYVAILPASAGAFHPVEHAAAAAAAGANALDYDGRFALDASCFDDAAAGNFPDGCLWLDSQEKLEALLGDASLRATEIMQTGPLVLWDKKAVSVGN